jgi:hypothetical protein
VTTYVLVASPLVGPAGWKWLAAALTARGHAVVVPELAPPDTPPPAWAAHVDRLGARLRGVSRPVLVGHSAAGRLIPLVAERVEGARCLYVDAQLPVGLVAPSDDDWFLAHVRSLAGDGRLPPWSEWWGGDVWKTLVPDTARRDALAAALPRIALAAVEEIPPPPGKLPPGAYLRLSAVYDAEVGVAAGLGWPVRSIDGGHLHFVVDEDAVADAIEELADQLDG